MVSIDDAVVPGDRVAAVGWVTTTDDGTWWLLPRIGPGAGPPERGPHSEQLDPIGDAAYQLGVTGASTRVEVRGVWNGGSIEVVEAVPPGSGHRDFFDPPALEELDLPGEWPEGKVPSPSPTEEQERHLLITGALVSRTILRVRGREVLAAAAVEPAEVEELLRGTYGDHLHLFRSAWSKEEYDSAADTLRDNVEHWDVIVAGDQPGPTGQAMIVVQVRRLSPEMARWHDGLPPGLVDLRPWLRRWEA